MASPSRHNHHCGAAIATHNQDDDTLLLLLRRCDSPASSASVSPTPSSSASASARRDTQTKTRSWTQTRRPRRTRTTSLGRSGGSGVLHTLLSPPPSSLLLIQAQVLLLLLLVLAQTRPTLAFAAAAGGNQEPLSPESGKRPWPSYRVGQSVPVQCLNRTVDTGEHITDASGQLQYVPFPVCNETGKPLELSFGVEQDLNCTIDFISDPLFHLLEFYVHNDAPLTCRVPSHPLPGSIISRPDPSSSDRKLNRNAHRNRNKNEATEADADEYSVDALSSTDAGALGSQSTAYTPLVIALTGTLQLSHLHVASTLNVLLHTSSSSSSSKKKKKKKTSKKAPASSILAATAYSASADDTSASDSTHSRIVIGDALPLRLRVRWYDGPSPPFGALSSSSTPFSVGGGGCSARAVLFYCALSAGAAVAVSFAWWRGVEMPRRLVRGVAGGGYGYGYGYGVGKEARLEGGLGENGNGARAYNGYGYSGLGLGLGNAGGGGGGGVGSGGKRD